ncbi:MAG: aminopeptidase P family protein [Firmicutes bacterium]|nr:aminopeptidase P family protein [Bacillota bacterium]
MKKELLELRSVMAKHGIDCYIVPSGDYHGSEYLNDYFKTRAYVSGFTGSAGTLVVTKNEAKLWTDGRYFIQAAAQLDGSGIDLMKMFQEDVPTVDEYLDALFDSWSAGDGASTAGAVSSADGVAGASCVCGADVGRVLGFDGMVLDNARGAKYKETADKHGVSINCELDLVGEIWTDRPELKGAKIWKFPLSSAGVDYEAKIDEVRKLMAEAGVTHHFIAGLMENAWLYNLRGSDVDYTPVFFSYTLISPNNVELFLLPGGYEKNLIPDGVTVRDYFDVIDALKELPTEAKLLMDPRSTSYAFFAAVPEGVEVVEAFSPVTRLKAIKNPVEIESTINAHVKDGVAMVNFIYWLKKQMAAVGSAASASGDTDYAASSHVDSALTEISASDYLESMRKAQNGFIDLSFDTISGYARNGAIIHYKATPETDKLLEPHGFLLVDSGGQYIDGTTDITRTIALGALTKKMIESYTTVLRGHIALATARFPDGTTGAELDEITREPLKASGIDYNHGTGHGIGHVLCVHEGPNSISALGGKDQPIIPGMITSNEPGVYFEDEFGIRIESEILCEVADSTAMRGDANVSDCDADATYYNFRTITYCPLEPTAIDVSMLADEELAFINGYHAEVFETLSPYLNAEVREWLAKECADLKR